MMGFITWALMGTMKMGLLAYQDVKNNKFVDDRYNYFMIGATIMLLAMNLRSLFYMVPLSLGVAFIIYISAKKQIFGEADLKTIGWSFLGFGILDFSALLCYILTFTAAFLMQIGASRYFFKTISKHPAYPMFFISFVFTCVYYLV